MADAHDKKIPAIGGGQAGPLFGLSFKEPFCDARAGGAPDLEGQQQAKPVLSIVVPMHNEEGAAAALTAEIAAALEGEAIEIIAVDDCSRDATLSVLKAQKERLSCLRVLHHKTNAGQSRAVRTGVLAARGPVIATLDGDGQNDPADIVALWRALIREDAPPLLAMAAGERRKRQDSAAKKWASRVANGFRARALNDGSADTGCGLKVFYREAYLRLPYFDHMHRYLPALMAREGFEVDFMGVGHRPRVHGQSNYTNIGRLAVAFRDVLGVMWLNDRSRKPNDIFEL